MLDALTKKPQGTVGSKKADVFMPPFEDGLFIGDISETHSLVFNKFCVCDEHVILITKVFEDQQSVLN